MSVAEVNFLFNGLHCLRDFGCIFIEKGNRTISPATNVNTYTIAGVSGTILLGDKPTHEPYTLSGVLVPMKTPDTMQAAQQLARRVSAWLMSGRGMLSWDYEPMQQHHAEVVAPITWDTTTWMDGGLSVTFLVQPYTYDIAPTVRMSDIPTGTSMLLVPVSTGQPCPVSIRLANKGPASIRSVRVATEAGRAVEFSKGMSISPGAVLALTMEPPISATIIAAGQAVNALPYATRFDLLTISGPEYLTIDVDSPATVEVSARGCVL